MASRSIGGIYASLSLKDSFSAGLKKARSGLNSFGNAVPAAFVAAGAAVTAAMVAGVRHTLSMTDELVDLSNQTGIAVADTMLLQQAYKDGGRSAEMMAKDIAKMQKALVTANEGGADPFAEMGLSVQALMAMNPAAQFQTIGAAIMGISNPAERTAKALEIFGKGGIGMTTVFPGMEQAANALGRMPELAERFGGAMGKANDLIGHLPNKSDQFFTGFTAGIIGELLPQLENIDKHDFTDVGQSLGKSLATGFRMFLDGTWWEALKLKLAQTMDDGISAGTQRIGQGLNMAMEMGAGVVAAGANTIVGNGSWEDNWNRALSAMTTPGEVEQSATHDAFQQMIDSTLTPAIEKVADNLNKAADLSRPQPITRPTVLTPTIQQTQIDTSQYGVDASTRVGLGMTNGSMATTQQGQQVDLLTQIRDILRQMDGVPVF